MLLRLLLLGGSGSGSGSGVGAAAPGSNGGTTGRQHQQQQQQPLLHGQARRGMPVGALAAAGGGYKPVGVCIGPPSQPPPPLLVRLASQAGSQVALTGAGCAITCRPSWAWAWVTTGVPVRIARTATGTSVLLPRTQTNSWS